MIDSMLSRVAARLPGRWLALVVLWFSWGAAAWAAQPPTLQLEEVTQQTDLTGRMTMLKTARQLSLDEVKDMDRQGLFELYAAPQHTPSGAVFEYWFKLELEYQGREPRTWTFDSKSFSLTRFELFGPPGVRIGRADHVPPAIGIRLPRSGTDMEADQFVRSFLLTEPGRYVLYVHAQSLYGARLAPSLWDTHAFDDDQHTVTIYRGVCYGLILATSLLGLGFLVIFRERVYAWSSLTAAMWLLTLVIWNGHAYRLAPDAIAPHLWPLTGIVPALGIFCYSRFASAFLDLSRYSRVLGRVINGFGVAAVASCLLFVANQLYWALMLLNVIALLSPFCMLAAGIYVLRRGYLPARWFVIGFLYLCVTTVLVAVSNLDIYPIHYRNEILVEALVVENLLFCIAQASRILRIRHLSGISSQQSEGATTFSSAHASTTAGGRLGWESAAINVLASGSKAAVLTIALERDPTKTQAGAHEALQRVFDTIRKELGPREVCVAQDDAEFVVVFTDVSNKAMLAARTEYLLEKLAAMELPDSVDAQRASVGVALYPEDGKDLATLMRKSLQARQYVFENGGAGYAFHDEIAPKAQR